MLKTLYALTKPKSGDLGADKKREERAKKAEALLAKYQGKTAADLRGMRAAALQSAAKGSELAEKIAAELKKVLRVKTSAEDAAIGEERKGASYPGQDRSREVYRPRQAARCARDP
jgi:hypothetical protein